MSHIFISYSREDLALAKPIVAALAKDNLDVWIDWEDIPKGEELSKEIYQGIEEADAFLFLVSPASVQSEWCNKEIDHAVKNGKRILPIAVRYTEPKSAHHEIEKRLWIFCREGQDDFDKAIEDTCKAIRTDYKWLKFHTKLQAKALEWERAKDSSRLLRGKELQEAEQALAGIGSQKDPQPTDLQREFTVTSRSDDKRRASRARVFGVAFVVIALAAGVAAWVLLDRTPAAVSVEGEEFEIRNRSGFRFLKQDVGSTISVYSEPRKLTPEGEYRFVIGTGTDGDRPGTILAYNMKGKIEWKYAVDDDPYYGPPGNFKIRMIIIDEILRNGQSQVLFTAQKSDWFPTELLLLDAEGKLLGSYWNSGFIYDVLRQDFDGDGIREMVVSAVNNNLGYAVVNDETKHPVIVYVLSPAQDFTGQTFPDFIPNWPSGTEYNNWIAVFEPYFISHILLRSAELDGKNLIEVVFDPQGGYIWMDEFGKILRVGLSDHWRSQQGDKSPADFVCFLTRESDGWYISGRIDKATPCPWLVRE